MTLLAVALGGALGAVGRFTLGGWVQGLTNDALPWGTFFVNVTGSFGLGLTMVWLHSAVDASELRHFLVIGLLGSFTTFSTFSYEALGLLREGAWWRASAYLSGSVLLGLLGVVAGMAVASGISQARG